MTRPDKSDTGAADALSEALAGNCDVDCMRYCYGGSAKVDVAEVLADLEASGWRLARADSTGEKPAAPGGLCERVLVGRGTDQWDPLCGRLKGHEGRCE